MLTTRDYRDMVIEHLTQNVLERDEALNDALRDREGYRFLAQGALHRIADLTKRNDRLQDRVRQLVAELRAERDGAPKQAAPQEAA